MISLPKQDGGSAQTRFSTDMFAPDERVPAWCEAYGRTIAKLELDPCRDSPFEADATMRELPGLGIVSTTTGKLNWACSVESDDLILVTVETGLWFCSERGRREISLTPGTATVCTKTEVARGTTFGRRSMIRVPYKMIAPMCGDMSASFHRPIASDSHVLKLLRPYVSTIQDNAAPPELQHIAVTHVHDLLALLVRATPDGAEVARSRGLAAARLNAIKQDIARHLGDENFTIGAIALQHKVTPRYIQMLFENEGTTFTEYVLAERLARAHRMLLSTRYADQKIIAVAYDAGFASLSYFIRAFRRRYGASPSDVRAQARREN